MKKRIVIVAVSAYIAGAVTAGALTIRIVGKKDYRQLVSEKLADRIYRFLLSPEDLRKES